ncbi:MULTISPECIES: glycosyltransferase [Olivibacter]|uniref:Glycosyltransferase n=1 Tax=Olivibacter jilunii TaxID=985016 RepID=A0ABW6B791_9SPHI
MKNNLLLITRRFPYFKTEAFLESEINILSEYFETIQIFPSEISVFRREVPANVRVGKELAAIFKRKVARAIITLCSGMFYKCLWDHRSKVSTYKDFLLVFHFTSRVVAFRKFFLNNIELFNDYKIIYTYWFSESTYTLLKLRQKLNLDIKIVSRAHRYDIYEEGIDTLQFWPYRKFCLENVDQVYSVSDDGKTFLEQRYGIKDKVSVSRLGVFDRNQISLTSENGQLSIVSVSRVEGLKRVELIFRSLLEFSERNPTLKIKWTHFGAGSLFDSLKSLVDSTNSYNLIVDLRGNVKNQEIYDFYGSAPVDLFVNLSTSEGIPVSIMEAQSFGIPVVATDVGGTKEIVDNSTGKLLPLNIDIQSVCVAIEQLISSTIRREQVKQIWNSKYNAKMNYHGFARTLSGLSKATK